MKFSVLVLVCALTMGCGTSMTIIDASWDDLDVRQSVSEIGSRGSGVVELTSTDQSASGRRVRSQSAWSGQFEITGDSLHWTAGGHPPMPLHRVETILDQQGRDNRKGAQNGAMAGLAGGAIVGLVAGLAMTEECDPDVFLDLFCGAGGGDVLALTAISALAGGVAGAFWGAIVGARKKTLYRFRANTPREMKVVVSISPPQDMPLR